MGTADGRHDDGLPARYELRRHLGDGSQKRVWLAHDRLLQRPVAIARVHSGGLDEARRIALLSGRPHIVAIHDALPATTDGYWLVLQYVGGGNLEQRLADGALAPDRAVAIARAVTLALEAAHTDGIVHQDLKPSNVLFDDAGRVFVSDFSLARPPFEWDGTDAPEDFGTLSCVAPERIRGEPCDARSDFYALGCLLYEMLHGHAAFRGDGPAILRAHLSRDRPVIDPAVPPRLARLVGSLLAVDPADRPGDAGAVLQRLADAVAPDASRPSGDLHPLVARGHDLGRIDAWLHHASDRGPTYLVVESPPGGGRTAFLDAVMVRLVLAGAWILRGSAEESTPRTYPVLSSMVRQIGDAFAPPGIAGSELLRTLSDPVSEAAAEASAALEEASVVARIANFVTAASRRRPIVALIDDAQWITPAESRLLERVLASVEQGPERVPLLLLGSVCVDAGTPPDWLAERCQARIPLRPLDADEVADWLESRERARPDPVRVTLLHESSGGNPLLLDRLHRWQLARPEPEGVTPDASRPLPGDLGALLARSFSRLSPHARRALQWAALLGQAFGEARLRAVLDIPQRALREALETLRNEDFLRPTEDDAARTNAEWSFVSPAIRTWLRDRVGPRRRAEMHLKIHRALDGLANTEAAGSATERAFHLLRAGDHADPVTLTTLLADAAEELVRQFAWDASADHLTAAIDAAERAPTPVPGHIANLHMRLGFIDARRYRTTSSSDHYARAAEGLAAAGDPVRATLAELRVHRNALVSSTRTPDASMEAHIRAALDRLPADAHTVRAEAAYLLADLASVRQQPETAERHAREALEEARAAGDAALASTVANALALVQLELGRPRTALSTWTAARDEARAHGSTISEDRAVQRLPLALLACGDIDGTRAAAEDAVTLSRRIDNRGEHSLALAARSAAEVMAGEIDAGWHTGLEAVRLARASEYPYGLPVVAPAMALAAVLGARGADPATALSPLADAASGRSSSLVRRCRMLAAVLSGERAAESTQFERALEILRHPTGSGGPARLADLARICVAIELAWHAEIRVDVHPSVAGTLDRALQDGVRVTSGWPLFVPRIRGLVADLTGEPSRRDGAFAIAAQLAQDCGALGERARIDAHRQIAGDPVEHPAGAVLGLPVTLVDRMHRATR